MRTRFGPFTLDGKAHQLTRDGVPLDLTPKAFAFLQLLVEAQPQTVTRDALYASLWPDSFVEPGNLHNLVAEVRAALNDREHEFIRTVHRVGYAFAGIAQHEDPRRFAILFGDDEIALVPGENRIGRDPRHTLVIDAPEVSRHHATLIADDSGVRLHDLGSKNGTYLRGNRITEPCVLEPGDELVIGPFRLRLIERKTLAATKTSE
jgi:DNA-binding winged helix-turn-helix (wHTH) protein